MIFKELAMYREIFFFSAIIILFFYTQFNEADNPFPLGESRITNKSIMENHKISAYHEINALKQSSDINKARARSYFNLSAKQGFPFHLKCSIDPLSDVSESSQYA